MSDLGIDFTSTGRHGLDAFIRSTVTQAVMADRARRNAECERPILAALAIGFFIGAALTIALEFLNASI